MYFNQNTLTYLRKIADFCLFTVTIDSLIIFVDVFAGMPPMGRAGAMPPQMRPSIMQRAPPPGGRGSSFEF